MNILTFDIEEWFHILDNDSTKEEKEWCQYESRIHKNTHRLLDILQRHNVKATFFCLGWIARKYPEIIQEIDNKGFEIACHSTMHQLVFNQTPSEFRSDLFDSIKIIEDIIGKRVVSYRAPGFSITPHTKWAFEILAEAGIENDCSIFPANRNHGGYDTFPGSVPSIIKINGSIIREFPVNITEIAGRKYVFSGGGYFRLFPYRLIKKWTRKSNYVMSYLHPRDFDFNQPMIQDLSPDRKFKSYFGLKQSEEKLSKWLNDFDFVDLHTAISIIDWEKVDVISLDT